MVLKLFTTFIVVAAILASPKHRDFTWSYRSSIYRVHCFIHACRLTMKKNCREISEHKIAVCEKTAGLRSGNSSDLDSAIKVQPFESAYNGAYKELNSICPQCFLHTYCTSNAGSFLVFCLHKKYKITK